MFWCVLIGISHQLVSVKQKPNTSINTNTRNTKLSSSSQMKKLIKNSLKNMLRSIRNINVITAINQAAPRRPSWIMVMCLV